MEAKEPLELKGKKGKGDVPGGRRWGKVRVCSRERERDALGKQGGGGRCAQKREREQASFNLNNNPIN